MEGEFNEAKNWAQIKAGLFSDGPNFNTPLTYPKMTVKSGFSTLSEKTSELSTITPQRMIDPWVYRYPNAKM